MERRKSTIDGEEEEKIGKRLSRGKYRIWVGIEKGRRKKIERKRKGKGKRRRWVVKNCNMGGGGVRGGARKVGGEGGRFL